MSLVMLVGVLITVSGQLLQQALYQNLSFISMLAFLYRSPLSRHVCRTFISHLLTVSCLTNIQMLQKLFTCDSNHIRMLSVNFVVDVCGICLKQYSYDYFNSIISCSTDIAFTQIITYGCLCQLLT